MNARLAFCARGWLLCASAGLFVIGPPDLFAQTNTAKAQPPSTPKAQLREAIQREMNALQPRDSEETPDARTARTTENSSLKAASQTESRRTDDTAAPRGSLVQTAGGVRSSTSRIRQTSGTANQRPQMAAQQQSEILRQLEALYARDGKQMPSMNLSDIPNTSGERHNVDIRRNPEDAQQKSSSPIDFFKKINPFTSRSRNEQRPEVRPANRPPNHPATAPTSRHPLTESATPQPQLRQQPAENAGSGKSPRVLPDFLLGRRGQSEGAAPIPAENQNNRPAGQSDERRLFILDDDDDDFEDDDDDDWFDDDEFDPEEEDRTQIANQPPAQTGDSIPDLMENFDDLFPELSEAEADGVVDAPVARTPAKPPVSEPSKRPSPESEESGSPFTGLTLDEAPPLPTEAPEQVAENRGDSADDPFEATIRLPSEMPELSQNEPDAPAPFEEDDFEAAELPEINPTGDNARNIAERQPRGESQTKLQKIAERQGMSGLKGFCPVALRDKRDLVDALPEFHSVYEGKSYYFSSSDAKHDFDLEPVKYVPAAQGHDIVLMEESSEMLEGSLDHAVWFRDRLYLFSSRDSLNIFVQQPSLYVQED